MKTQTPPRLQGLLQCVRPAERDRARHLLDRRAIHFSGFDTGLKPDDSGKAAHERSPDISSAKAA